MPSNQILTADSEYWIAPIMGEVVCGQNGAEEPLFAIKEVTQATEGFRERIIALMMLQAYLDNAGEKRCALREWHSGIDCDQTAHWLLNPEIPTGRSHLDEFGTLWVDTDSKRLPVPCGVETPFLYQVDRRRSSYYQAWYENPTSHPPVAAHTAWVIGYDEVRGRYVVMEKAGWHAPFRIVGIDTSEMQYCPCVSGYGTIDQFVQVSRNISKRP